MCRQRATARLLCSGTVEAQDMCAALSVGPHGVVAWGLCENKKATVSSGSDWVLEDRSAM